MCWKQRGGARLSVSSLVRVGCLSRRVIVGPEKWSPSTEPGLQARSAPFFCITPASQGQFNRISLAARVIRSDIVASEMTPRRTRNKMAKKAESKRATDSNGATNGKHAADRMPDASPIYFRSLQVRNVRCFGDEPQTIHFNTPDGSNWAKWTIILGNNGTGKSTLLQILDRLSVDSDPFCQPSDEESEWLVFDDTKLTEKPNFKRDESSTARLPSSYESRAEIEYGVQKQEGASLSYSVGSLVKVSFGAGFRRSETFEHFEKGEVYEGCPQRASVPRFLVP